MHTLTITLLNTIDFEKKSVSLRSDGLILVRFKTDDEVDVNDVKEVVGAIEKLGNGKVFPLLIISGKFTLPSPETRAYIATAESDPFASAEAYVIHSFPQKIVGNIFIKFNQPARPTRIFTSEDKAVEWLYSFL